MRAGGGGEGGEGGEGGGGSSLTPPCYRWGSADIYIYIYIYIHNIYMCMPL